MNSLSLVYVKDFLDSNFSGNGSGYRPPFEMKLGNIVFHSIDTEHRDGGVTRFQGVVYYQSAAYPDSIYPELMPIELAPYVRKWSLLTFYPTIKMYCVNIWFKEPMTQEIWNSI